MESNSTLVEEISKVHEIQPSPDEKLVIKGAPLTFSLAFKKNAHNMEVGTDNTLGELRMHIAKVTEVEPGLQKLMYKGMLKDDSKTLGELGIQNGIKMMLVGTSISEVLSVAAPTPSPTESKKEEQAVSEPLSEKLPHKKIVEKGPPDGAEPGKRGRNESLPEAPLNNIYNNIGVKVRLTFKLYTQELWIQSSSNTQKLPFSSIRSLSSEPIKGREEYHIMALQIGSSERNKYYLYFVPCQYTRAIRNAIMSDYLG